MPFYPSGIFKPSLSWGQDDTESNVIVRVAGRVRVAVRRATIPRVVVPAAAAYHAFRAFDRTPFCASHYYHNSPMELWSIGVMEHWERAMYYQYHVVYEILIENLISSKRMHNLAWGNHPTSIQNYGLNIVGLLSSSNFLQKF